MVSQVYNTSGQSGLNVHCQLKKADNSLSIKNMTVIIIEQHFFSFENISFLTSTWQSYIPELAFHLADSLYGFYTTPPTNLGHFLEFFQVSSDEVKEGEFVEVLCSLVGHLYNLMISL